MSEHDWSNIRSGAMNEPGLPGEHDYGLPAGEAARIAERVQTRLPLVRRADGSYFDPESGRDVPRTGGLPQGYGDPRFW